MVTYGVLTAHVVVFPIDGDRVSRPRKIQVFQDTQITEENSRRAALEFVRANGAQLPNLTFTWTASSTFTSRDL